METDKPLLVFVTGQSGAGRSVAMSGLEDSGFYCIDNLPFDLILQTCEHFHGKGQEALAIGLRIMNPEQSREIPALLAKLKNYFDVDLIYLACEEDVIVTRYNSTRRKHPFLDTGGELIPAIRREKNLLSDVEKIALAAFDTSYWSPHQLLREIEKRYASKDFSRLLYVSVISFGFKYGGLRPADTIIDARFLDNPYFVKELRDKNGLNDLVKNYIEKDKRSKIFLEKLVDLFQFLLPNYHAEGKNYFRLGIGCTGGKHRSVYIAEELSAQLAKKNMQNILFSVLHRDMNEFNHLPQQ